MFGLGSTEMIILVIMFLIGVFALFGFRQFLFRATSNIIKKEPATDFNKLTELKNLFDKGVLTQAEFDSEKRKILI